MIVLCYVWKKLKKDKKFLKYLNKRFFKISNKNLMGNDVKNPRDKTTIKKEKSFSKEKINNSVSHKKKKEKI